MNWARAIVIGGLTAIHPALGAAASLISYLANGRSPGIARLIAAGATVVGACADLLDFDLAPERDIPANDRIPATTLAALSFASDTAISTAFNAASKGNRGDFINCVSCGKTDVMKVVTHSGDHLCRGCFENTTKGITLASGQPFDPESYLSRFSGVVLNTRGEIHRQQCIEVGQNLSVHVVRTILTRLDSEVARSVNQRINLRLNE